MNKTLKEIAKISGVSLGTVSRILNGKPGFNPHTVTKVKNIAGKLDYFPYCKSRTKGMLRNPQKYIGIITPPMITALVLFLKQLSRKYLRIMVFILSGLS